jgi:hypothetical protein
MNRRRRRHLRILVRFRATDVVVVIALLAIMLSALLRRPDKAVADVAIPTAFLIAFCWWRER